MWAMEAVSLVYVSQTLMLILNLCKIGAVSATPWLKSSYSLEGLPLETAVGMGVGIGWYSFNPSSVVGNAVVDNGRHGSHVSAVYVG